VRAVTPLRGAVTQPPRTVPSNRTLGQEGKKMTKTEIEAMSFQQKLDKLRNGIVIPPPDRIDRQLDIEKVKDIAMSFTKRGDFQIRAKTAYNWAHRKGVLDEVCDHMEAPTRGRKPCAR